jgi:phage tail-like protein
MPVRYPLSKYLFRVEVDGLTQAGFRSVSGLSWEHEVVEYQEGGRNAAMVRLPGQQRLGAVTLTRGFIEGAEFAAWAREARENRGSSRRSIDIVALRDDHTEASRFTLLRAWPRKFETQALTSASEGLVETLELAHEGIISAHSREPQPSQGQAWAQGDTRARLDAAGQRARDAARAQRGEAVSVNDGAAGQGSVSPAAGDGADEAQAAPAMPTPEASGASALGGNYAGGGGPGASAAEDPRAQVSQAMRPGVPDDAPTAHDDADSLRAACGIGGADAGGQSAGARSSAGFAATGSTGDAATQQGHWSDGVERRQPPGAVPEPPIEPGNTLSARV